MVKLGFPNYQAFGWYGLTGQSWSSREQTRTAPTTAISNRFNWDFFCFSLGLLASHALAQVELRLLMVFLQELNCIVKSQNCCTGGFWLNMTYRLMRTGIKFSITGDIRVFWVFINKLIASYLDAGGLNAQRKVISFWFLNAMKRPVIQRKIFTLLTTCLFEKELLTRKRFYRLLDTNNIFEKTGQAKILKYSESVFSSNSRSWMSTFVSVYDTLKSLPALSLSIIYYIVV